ncbi:MAG: hypothetical protein RIS84_125, partial [Pseudomonadota bacterium]
MATVSPTTRFLGIMCTMYDYLIIGGGISGLLTALELRRAGLKV